MSSKGVPKIDTVSEATKLIAEGRKAVSKNKDIEDIVLLIGNTGAGKSTVSRLLASPEDLKSQKVIDRCIIRDKGERISGGEDTTVSKTLFPELIQDPETGTAFYDLPGFCDTRTESVEIANAFCMKAVADQAKRVKLLFIINHSSLLTGETRLDLPAFLVNSANFIKNQQKFVGGIALVATKVRGETDNVIQGIVNFLTLAKRNLTATIKEDATRIAAEEILNAILTKDSSNNYVRIAYFREPKESGPVPQIKSVMKDRAKIYGILQSNLEYCNSAPEDFGLSVSYQAQCVVLTIADQTQHNITCIMTKVAKRLEVEMEREVQNCDPTGLGTLVRHNKSFEASIKILQGDPNIRWQDFLRNFFQIMNVLNATGVLEKEFEELQQAKLTLAFCEKLSECQVSTRVVDWTFPFYRLVQSARQAIVNKFSSFFADMGTRFVRLIKRIGKSLDEKTKACSDDRHLGRLYEQYANWSRSLAEELYTMKSVNKFVEHVQSRVRTVDAGISTFDLVKLENDVEFESVFFHEGNWLKPFEDFATKLREEHSCHTYQCKNKEELQKLKQQHKAEAEAQKRRMDQLETANAKLQEQSNQFNQKTQNQEKEIEAMKKDFETKLREEHSRHTVQSKSKEELEKQMQQLKADAEAQKLCMDQMQAKLQERSNQFDQKTQDQKKQMEAMKIEKRKQRKESCVRWVPMSGGKYPKDAFVGGKDNGKNQYVVRASHNGSIIPGKLNEGDSRALFSENGKEYWVSSYEVLVAEASSLSWILAPEGKVPFSAIEGGWDNANHQETYYIGRFTHNGALTVGKIHLSRGMCFIPYKGKEFQSPKYEVLAQKEEESCSIL